MAKRAIIRNSDNMVICVAEWDGIQPWVPPDGTSALSAAQSALPNCGTGATWTGSGFTPPPEIIPEQLKSIYWGVLNSVGSGVKPASVTRTYREHDYTIDCYITQDVRNDYIAGKIVIGDFVLVAFADDDLAFPIIISKVYKTW